MMMRNAKVIAKTQQRDGRMVVAGSSLVLLTVIVLITSLLGAAAPV
jgi:hypothetical protein